MLNQHRKSPPPPQPCPHSAVRPNESSVTNARFTHPSHHMYVSQLASFPPPPFQMKDEPALARYFRMTLLTYDTMERALAYHLACKLGNDSVSMETWDELLADVLEAHAEPLGFFFRADLVAILMRDPAAEGPAHAFLNFK